MQDLTECWRFLLYVTQGHQVGVEQDWVRLLPGDTIARAVAVDVQPTLQGLAGCRWGALGSSVALPADNVLPIRQGSELYDRLLQALLHLRHGCSNAAY